MKKILFIAFIITQSNLVNAQTYAWTQKADYGGGEIYDPFGFSIGAKGYVGGGRDLNSTYHHDFWEWDQPTNVWTQKANYSGPNVYGARGFNIAAYGYVVSGYTGSSFSNNLWQYDPTTNIWSQKQSHPAPARYTAVAIAINGKAYFGTGSVFASAYYTDWYEYDPALNSWTQKTNFIGSARQGASSFVIGTDGYVGMGGDQSTAVDNNDFYKYNSLTNTWTQVASVPGHIRNAALSFAFSGTGFVTQGYNIVGANDSVFRDHYSYDPIANAWTQLPDFPSQPHFEGVYFNIGVRGYIGLGSDTVNGSHYMNDFWEYGPVNTGINENNISDGDIKVYLAEKNTLKIEFLKSANRNFQFNIYDETGKVIIENLLTCGNKFYEINLNTLSKGIYAYQIIGKNKKIKSGKVIIF